MTIFKKTLLAGSLLCASFGTAYAGCGIEKGTVSVLANDFPALHAVVSAAESCAGDGVEFSKNHSKDFKDVMIAALTATPAEYSSVVVNNGVLVTLMNDGLLRPLDDLIEKHGAGLKKNQLITVDGKVMAVAFMANAQHLFYRQDILDAAGVDVPKSYEDVLAASKAIKEKGLMDYPYTGTFKAGWNLGEEFINMYMGTGGNLFKEGSAELDINNEHGMATLNMMKSLTEYMNPDYLTFDSNVVQADWEAGNAALSNLWGSRAAAVLDDEGSTEAVTSTTQFDSAPALGGGSTPATTLWWDGFSVSANSSDEDAEATFVAMMNGISTQVANDNADEAVWLIDGYTPGAKAVGVAATVAAGAKPYPMVPYMGALHGAAGDELAEFLQGNEDAATALADIEAAYNTAAKEAGFLK